MAKKLSLSLGLHAGGAVARFLDPQVWVCRGLASPTVALPDLVDVLAVNLDSLASDPTVFHKRYLKKIRDLGEVGAGPGSRGRGLGG